MPYYVEYFTRAQAVGVAEFHERVKAFYEGWTEAHPEDEIVLLVGRSWRLGPRPEYMCVWKMRDFARFDEWQKELEAYLAEHPHETEQPFMVIESAGIFEDLGKEVL